VSQELSGVLFWSFFRDIGKGDYSNAVSAIINDWKAFNLSLLKEPIALSDICLRRDSNNW
jgi:hypothetical protein